MARGAVLGVAVAFTALLALLTLFVLVESGLDVLVVASALLVVVLAVGIGGSLRS